MLDLIEPKKHPKCKGIEDNSYYYDDGFECGYNTSIDCEDCKYNGQPYGRKDPAAKCNSMRNGK